MLHWLRFPFWNEQAARPRALWCFVLQFVLRVLLLVLCSNAIGWLAISQGKLAPRSSWNFVLKQWSPPTIGYQLLVLLVEPFAALLSVWVALRVFHRKPLTSLGFRFNARWWRDYLFGLIVGIGVMAFVFAAGILTGYLQVSGTFLSPDGVSFSGAMLLAFAKNVGNGVEEEVADRAYVLRVTAEGMQSNWISESRAILVGYALSSVFFGIGHVGGPHSSWMAVSNLVLIGAFFGLSYLFTGQLACAIGIHTTWNFAQSNLFGLSTSGREAMVSVLQVRQDSQGNFWLGSPEFGPEAGVFCLLGCLVWSAVVLWWVRRMEGSLQLKNSDWTKK